MGSRRIFLGPDLVDIADTIVGRVDDLERRGSHVSPAVQRSGRFAKWNDSTDVPVDGAIALEKLLVPPHIGGVWLVTAGGFLGGITDFPPGKFVVEVFYADKAEGYRNDGETPRQLALPASGVCYGQAYVAAAWVPDDTPTGDFVWPELTVNANAVRQD